MNAPANSDEEFDRSYEAWLNDPEIQKQRHEIMEALDHKYPPDNGPDCPPEDMRLRFTSCD